MSQQGPGGYGGGWGPPGGGGPGGHGPPGGPGGYGPGGAPPGWTPQPQGQPHYAPAPGGAPSGAPQAAKQTNPLVWVGLGCGVLFLLAAGAGVATFIVARNAANRAAAAAGAFSAALEIAVDGGVLSIDGGIATDGGLSTGLPPGVIGQGGPTCEKAAECCKRVVGKTGATSAALASCEGLRTNAAELSCQQALQAYQASAPLFGVSCP